MNKHVMCIWMQFSDRIDDPFKHVASVVTELLNWRSDAQAGSLTISVETMEPAAGRSRSTSIASTVDVDKVLAGIAPRITANVRISRGLRGQSKAFHDEAWSIEWMFGASIASGLHECVVCADVESLVADDECQGRAVSIFDRAILSEGIVSGVCEVAPWKELIGGQYFTRDAWSGFPRHRHARRAMWNDGGDTRGWLRDVAWITILGARIRAEMVDVEDLCREYAEFSDNRTQYRKQCVLNKQYGIAFVASSSPQYYYEEPHEECSQLNAWLSLKLRSANVLM